MVEHKRIYQCQDCYEETTESMGLLQYKNKIPSAVQDEFDDVYDDEFFYSHTDPEGPMKPIRPRGVLKQ